MVTQQFWSLIWRLFVSMQVSGNHQRLKQCRHRSQGPKTTWSFPVEIQFKFRERLSPSCLRRSPYFILHSERPKMLATTTKSIQQVLDTQLIHFQALTENAHYTMQNPKMATISYLYSLYLWFSYLMWWEISHGLCQLFRGQSSMGLPHLNGWDAI